MESLLAMSPHIDSHEKSFSPLNQTSIPASFNTLPLELKLQIFAELITPRTVKIFWSSRNQVFFTFNRHPALLSLSRDARAYALSHYRLAFSTSPDTARIYFNYELDTADFQWNSLAAYTGSRATYTALRTHLGHVDFGNLRKVAIFEQELIGRASENFTDLKQFTGLEEIYVYCDHTVRNVNQAWSSALLEDLWAGLKLDFDRWGEGGEKWPMLWCSSAQRAGAVSICSRHCFFDEWNKQCARGQYRKWPPILVEILYITRRDEVPLRSAVAARQLFTRMLRRHWEEIVPINGAVNYP